ncbi:MAG: type II toxin-antitoxin system RelE/ParE family toxin [Bacteroidetes bacterium]|nr:type II toxin-antitoxin system RelE/ParE family toxin [Bacteroidota bacterium]MCH8525348.1 type II toxin-antitoxin system RelE/ParE family toxin [Balneolales bacterium]
MQVTFLREAEIELIKSASFYEDKSVGLGGEFINEVNSTVQLIKKMPEASPLINSYARKALLSRFEYGIVYRVFNNQIIILAVMHSKREPNYWIGRK